MKRSVCLKSALRQPARTLVLILLVGAISFAFVSRVVEYLVVSRETDRLAGYYRSIGRLDVVEPGGDVSRAVDMVSKSPYVAFEDRRRYCSGALQGIHNADVDGYFADHFLRSDVLFYGQILSKAHLRKTDARPEEYRFDFAVDQVLTGYPEYVQVGREVRLAYFPGRVSLFPKYVPGTPDELETLLDAFEIGERYLVTARFDPNYQKYYRPQNDDDPVEILMIQPLIQSGAWVHKVEPGSSADLAAPSLVGLREEIAALEENQHTMSVYSTADMSAMPDVQETSRYLYLTQGRWLDAEDDSEGRRACVVHNDFAVRRGLSVGDTITLELRDLKDPWTGVIGYSEMSYSRWAHVRPGYIRHGEDWDSWQNYETHTQELEIVGLYGISWTRRQPTTFSTEMYIPDSCMPAGYCSRDVTDLSLYSFVLDSPEHEKAFLDENRQALEELGIQVFLVPTGWDSFQTAAVPLKQSLTMNARIFSAVLIPAMALAAFLHLWQRRRDFAILRSMGMPKGGAVRQLVWSLAGVGTTGVAAGGVLSWRYALGKAAKTLASLQGTKGAGLSADLSPAWLAGLCAAAITVLFSFTVAGALAVSRRPVLELLQGTESRAVRKRRPAAGPARESFENAPVSVSGSVQVSSFGGTARSVGEAQVTGDPGRVLSCRHMLRHSLRAPSRSILTISVALGFTLALGWLDWSIERNEAKLDELYRATQVEAEIVKTDPTLTTASSGGGFIPSDKVDAVLESGFVKDAYLVATARASTVGAFVSGEEAKRDYKRTVKNVPLIGYSQPERGFFSQREMQENRAVEYAEGWDESLFSRDWVLEEAGGRLPAVLPLEVVSSLGLELGDDVWLLNSAATFTIAGQYTGSGSEPPILLPFSVIRALAADNLHYMAARFAIDPEKNRQLPEFRAKMNEVFGTAEGKVADVSLIVWEGEMTQVVEPMEKNLLLVRILRSVTIAVSTLIAAGLGALMVFQHAKEASIMRVLGVTKRLARSMLCGEQALLCILGLVLGLGSYAALRGQASAAFTGPALGCAALYLAGCLIGAWQGARAVTDRAPLELLQVKE